MEIDTLKLKRRGNRSAVTRHIRKLEELMENADSVDFNEDGLLTMFETLTQKRTFLENIDEHILELTDPSKMEGEIMDTDEYSVGVDTKIRKIPNQFKCKLERLKDTPNLKEQLSIAREVCTSLNSVQEEITPVLELLIEIYMTFPSKHQVKRIIISGFQSLSPISHDYVVKELTNQIDGYHKQDTSQTDWNPRKYIDIIAGLMDNFPIGEKCIDNLCIEILQHLSQILHRILNDNSTTMSSVQQNELMHNCLAGVQAENRILQKCYVKLTNQSKAKINIITSSSLEHDVRVLHTDEFLMDCKTTCAMNSILLIRLMYPTDYVTKIIEYLFEDKGTLDMTDPFTALSKGDNLTSQMCLLYGTMSVVELSELMEELHDGKCLLLNFLYTAISNITGKGYTDSINKLLSVKCFNMWTSKTRACLKAGLLSDTQKGLLHGTGEIIQFIMSYVWTVWEDSTDVIRIISREIFENVLHIHTMSSPSDISLDPFLQSLTRQLMFDVSWSSKGKYGMLCMLVQIMGAVNILQHAPDLPSTILSQMSEHALACHSSELYIQLCWSHAQESQTWKSVWINPILSVLAGSDKQQISNVIEYILSKLLKKGKDLLPYILERLSSQTDSSYLSSLVMCLRRARAMGLLDKQLESINNISGLINISLLQQALCHIDEQVRLDAFAFVCESHKTTAIVRNWELQLVRQFLPWNLNSQSPAFRQQMLSHLKKLLCRMKESESVLLRQMKNQKDSKTEKEEDLSRYKIFLSWLTRHLFRCLYPGSSFARRTTCLCALTLLEEIFGASSSGFTVSDELQTNDFQTLVDCLTDTFEDNKMEAYKLLKYCSRLEIMKQSHDSVDGMFETAMTLAGSTRPQDSTTAAYLFKVLLLQGELFTVMSRSRSFTVCKESFDKQSQVMLECPLLPVVTDSQSGRILHMLLWLLHYLKSQTNMAKQSLVKAACTLPLYPTLHCIRYVMQDIIYRSIPTTEIPFWREFVSSLLHSCFQISEIVSPVVQNSSPEGNIPVEVMGDLHDKFDGSIMPEYLTVCCWRSIKEVSLLLGQLCTNIPIVDPSGNDGAGLLTCQQLDEIGSYFKTQLLESIHRGAFELAYAGFVKMCDMLWRSSIEALYKLPKFWLSQLMAEIQTVSSKLCATRRSAGVPFYVQRKQARHQVPRNLTNFYVQALVTTEPVTLGRLCFKQAMSDLLSLALTEETSVMSESKVHALNILRAMFRDTRLGEDVTPFVAGGLKAAILGFKSKFWGVCNSSTLLFSALMTRIFGVKRSKDENNISKKNCQTGKAFFHKYPGLYNFMLELLAEATESVGGHRTVHLHPSLYPLLMVLARLFPSPLEGTDTSLNLSAFVPFILKCSESAVLKTRQMSAKALQPLVVGNNVRSVVNCLLDKLPVEGKPVHYSHIHGVLLQLLGVIDVLPSLEPDVRHDIVEHVATECVKRAWFLSRQSSCFIVEKESLMLTSKLLSHFSMECYERIQNLDIKLHQFLEQGQNLLTESYTQVEPGYTEYLTTLSKLLLLHCGIKSIQHCDRGDNSKLQCVRGDNSIEDILLLILNCCHYEVRMIGLVFLHDISTDEELGEDLVFSGVEVHPGEAVEILSSDRVLHKLLQMVTNETHFECQKLVLQTLKFHPSITDHSWFGDIQQLFQMFRHCLSYIQTCRRDELRAEVLQFTGYLINPLLQYVNQTTIDTEAGLLLDQWKDLLYFYKGTEQHEYLHLSVVKVLKTNADTLLVDSYNYWGDNTFYFWDILLSLLQEDSDEIKNIAAGVINKLNPKIQVTVHPFMALDLAVNSMLRIHMEKNWQTCCKTLLRWMDISDNEDTEEGARLFDKNEMNTWREDVQLVKIVTKYLTTIILQFDRSRVPEDFVVSGGFPLETVGKVSNESSIITNSPGCSINIDRDKLLLLHQELSDELYTSQPMVLGSCSMDRLSPLRNLLHGHLESVLERKSNIQCPSPFKDINKYIQISITDYKVHCLTQVCRYLFDSLICGETKE